ncbi:MAG: radical SAM protein, partial [Clostridiaceae bacterium]|nr:radical SAM protein [Clostridiaceae bacterium]
DCIYCNQKKISGRIQEINPAEMRLLIESYTKSAPENSYIEIGFYGGSFTGIEKEDQIKFLQIAKDYIDDGSIKGVRLSTRPDYISEKILEYLKQYRVSTIELGVQSLDNDVLQKSCRGHTAQVVYYASELIKEWGFSLGIQTMIGLPGDSCEKAIYTAKEVTGISPDIVRIYPALVIRDTYLEEMYKQGKYIPLALNEAVETCAVLLDIYRNNNINVIRIGLQPTENINESADVVAGPFHPAFRQLVESKLALNKIEDAILYKGLHRKSDLVIGTDKRKISNVVGQRRSNINYLKEKYKYNSVTVKLCEDGHEICDVKY